MRLVTVLLAIGMIVAPAAARADDDALKFAPVPAWVTKVPVPDVATDATRGQALAVRLLDEQVRFDNAGTHEYHHMVIRVTRAEALSAAGTIELPWQPGIGTLTINSLKILRGDQVIDVLKSQKFSIIRRENKLETGMLDGQLTAVMQVAGLQVGDSISLETVLDQRNPILDGHNEAMGSLFGGLTADHFHYAISWPQGRDVRYRVGDVLPKPRVATHDGITSVTIDTTAYNAPAAPASAPARVLQRGEVAASDFTGWNEVATLFAPLYAKASTIPADSPLQAEVARIAAASEDPKARAAAALQLVQSQVRYLADVSGLGGYLPADADTVWKNRYGDCKGKSVLLLALLHALGIEARPALVSSDHGDGMDTALPMPGQFDHVIVEATIAGKTYWLDGTRLGDRSLDALEVPAFKWALPLDPDDATLVALKPTPPAKPETEFSMTFDASAGIGIPAKASGEMLMRGDSGLSINAGLSAMSDADRDKALRDYWKKQLDFVTIDKVDYAFDDKTGEARMSFTGTGDLDWSVTGANPTREYIADYARVGETIAPDRKDGPLQSVPVVLTPDYDVVHETIRLPHGGKGFFLDGDQIDSTIAGIHYVRTARIADGIFTMTTTTRNPAAEISLADAKAADTKATALHDKTLAIRIPYDYAFSDAELAALHKDGAGDQTADKDGDDAALNAALNKVQTQMRANDTAGALKTLDAAIAKSGSTARLYSTRAGVHLMRGEQQAADADLDMALALDPHDRVALRDKVAGLSNKGRYDDASIVLDKLILLDPGEADLYLQRANLRSALGNSEGALADLAIVTRLQPDNVDAQASKVSILTKDRRYPEALTAADTFADKFPTRPEAQAMRANILYLMGRRDDARAAIARSLAIGPTVNAYATALDDGLAATDDEALADALAMARLEPAAYLEARALKPAMAAPDGYDKLLAVYDAALKAHPDERDGILMMRSSVNEAAGKADKALADLDTLVSEHPKAAMYLNNRCWFRATNDIQLAEAAKDCDAAIALTDGPSFRDSRGFLDYRRGDYKDAITDYDVALGKSPDAVASLYGRGLAKMAAGDDAGGRADIDRARGLSPTIDDRFAAYGVTPPVDKLATPGDGKAAQSASK